MLSQTLIKIINALGYINPFYNNLSKIKTLYNLLKYMYDKDDYTRCGITYENIKQFFESGTLVTTKKILNLSELQNVDDSVTEGYYTIDLRNNHIPNQNIINHVLIIEKKSNRYTIYQSFLFNYSVLDYINTQQNVLSKQQIIDYFEKIYSLSDSEEWNDLTKEVFKKCFNVDADVVGKKNKGENWKCNIYFTKYRTNSILKYLISLQINYILFQIISHILLS